jgi:hypothetical protein
MDNEREVTTSEFTDERDELFTHSICNIEGRTRTSVLWPCARRDYCSSNFSVQYSLFSRVFQSGFESIDLRLEHHFELNRYLP